MPRREQEGSQAVLEQDLGLLVIRLVVGLIFVAHGAQKVLGVWGGPGIVGWTGAMEHMGFRPARYWALLDSGVEFGCGILFVIGFLTPIAAAALLGHATVIILKVQLPRGFWNSKGGIEFPLSLAGGLLGILLIGAGGLSIDGLLHLGLMSEAWVKWIGAIAGIAGGAAIYLYSVRPSVAAPPA